MFSLIYAKSVIKDLKKITPHHLLKIKKNLQELDSFPDISQIKRLKNHPIADYRLRIGVYRVLFDVNWQQNEIHILKIAHRQDVY